MGAIAVLERTVRSRALATVLDLCHEGDDAEIAHVGPLDDLRPADLAFSSRSAPHPGVVQGSCVIALFRPTQLYLGGAWIESRQPRLDFARALRALDSLGTFVRCRRPPEVHRTAAVHPTAILGMNVVVGAGTKIDAHAVVHDGARIGEECWIRVGAAVGGDGFGFERDERGVPIRIMHFGGVVLGDRVEVGERAVVCQGTLSPTTVGDHTKIDAHAFVAHNAKIGKRCLVIAHAEISGSVVVEDDCWIGPNSCVRDNLRIGARSLVGIGAVVVRNVLPDTIVAGCPARVMEKRPT